MKARRLSPRRAGSRSPCTAFRRGSRTCARRRRARASARRKAAIAGFLKSAGLTSIDQAKIQKDAKKGDFYVAVDREARPRGDRGHRRDRARHRAQFPWPKSMRWGAQSAQPGALTWVRPLHSIVATFGPETEEPEVVKFDARRHRGRQHDLRPSLHRAGRDRGAPPRRLDGQAREGQGRPRSGAAAGHHPRPRRRTSPSRRASNWSRTTACSVKSPASSNGRWC